MTVCPVLKLNDLDLVPLDYTGIVHRPKDDTKEWQVEEWYVEGQRHRIEGPAYIHTDDIGGCTEWWFKDTRHRIGGPAREWYDGTRFWYFNDKMHRMDGAAAEWRGDEVIDEYYILDYSLDDSCSIILVLPA